METIKQTRLAKSRLLIQWISFRVCPHRVAFIKAALDYLGQQYYVYVQIPLLK